MTFIRVINAEHATTVTLNILRSRRKKLAQGMWRGPLVLAQSFSRFDHASFVCQRLREHGEKALFGHDIQARQPYMVVTPLCADSKVEADGGLRELKLFASQEFITASTYRCCDSYIAEVGNDYAD